MEYKGNSKTIENLTFTFAVWNLPKLQLHTKMTLFKFSELLSLTLKKSVIYEKLHGKEKLEKDIKIGIRLGIISVMRLDSKSKKY